MAYIRANKINMIRTGRMGKKSTARKEPDLLSALPEQRGARGDLVLEDRERLHGA